MGRGSGKRQWKEVVGMISKKGPRRNVEAEGMEEER